MGLLFLSVFSLHSVHLASIGCSAKVLSHHCGELQCWWLVAAFSTCEAVPWLHEQTQCFETLEKALGTSKHELLTVQSSIETCGTVLSTGDAAEAAACRTTELPPHGEPHKQLLWRHLSTYRSTRMHLGAF